jgi:hypothetical protein
MGSACSTYGGKDRCTDGFGEKRRGKDTTWKCVNGRILLKWIFEKWHRSMDRIYLAKDRDR